MAPPTPASGRRETYAQRSRFLVASAGLVVLAHAVDVVTAGRPNWPALGLRVAWASILLLEARALLRSGGQRLQLITVGGSVGSVVFFTAILFVTGGSHSPHFAFVYVLAMLAAMVMYDLLLVGLSTAALLIVGALVVLLLEGPPMREVVAWGHVGVISFAFSWVLAFAFRSTQRANERLIKELQGALANVKTLKGLLPVCAWCHRIRNDEGYWERLEAFISAHSEAEFSHGMCPECFAKHYGAEDPPEPLTQPPPSSQP